MAMPSITDAELVGLNASGGRVLSSASLTRRLWERARWLAEKKPAIHWSWSDGDDCPYVSTTLSTSGYTAAATNLRTYWTIGKSLVPAVGNETGIVRLYVRQQDYTSGTLRAGLRVRPQRITGAGVEDVGDWVDLGTSSLGSSNGWRSGTFTVPADIRDDPFEAHVYLTTWDGSAVSSAQTRITAWSLCSEGTAWSGAASRPFGAHFRRQSGPPDDAFTLRLLRDIHKDAAAVPVVLAHHSFLAQPTADNVNAIARYVIPAMMGAGDLTVWIRCRTEDGTAATVNATLSSTDTTTSAGAGLPAAGGTTALASSTAVWKSITLAAVAGSPLYLTVWVDPDATDTAQIAAVYATQDESADGAFFTGVPGWRLLPLSTRDATPGAPIVNSYSGGLGGGTPVASETIQNLWTDRFAALNNAAWWPQTRGPVTLPGDWCVPNDATVSSTSTKSLASPSALSKLNARWGATQIVAAARVSTNGLAIEDDEQLALVAGIDGTALPGSGPVAIGGRVPADAFRPFSGGDLTPGTQQEVSVAVGYTDAAGLPITGLIPARVEGVAIWERPPIGNANAVHRREYQAVGSNIPDNDAVTGVSSSIVVSGRAFLLKMPRAHVVITHANAAQLRVTLTDGTTTVRLADYGDLSGSGTQVFSFSDSYEDDTAPDQPLSAFAGVSTTDTWTLNVRDNAAGSTGTLDAWAVEFW